AALQGSHQAALQAESQAGGGGGTTTTTTTPTPTPQGEGLEAPRPGGATKRARKSHSCEACGKAFRDVYHLKRHQ
ncbi:MAZ protein, partial [Psilopogon haemacephalus]|nr:MAZ protein [Psilopogon haemacephalus]